MGKIYYNNVAYGGGSSGAQIDDTTTANDKVWSSQKTASEISQAGGAEIDDTTTANNKVWSSSKTSTELSNKINTSSIGVTNGVASLGNDGKVPSSQLPASTVPTLKKDSYRIYPTTTMCTGRQITSINVDITDTTFVSRFNNNNAFIEFLDMQSYTGGLNATDLIPAMGGLTVTSSKVTIRIDVRNISEGGYNMDGFIYIHYCYFE